MRKIFGTKMVVSFSLLLIFSICLTARADSNGTKKTSISIPYLDIREAEQEGLFLLIFDVSGSMWTSEKNYLSEDFKTIYCYLSTYPWAVEQDAILFDEEVKLRSADIKEKRQNISSEDEKPEYEIWITKKNTDLKKAFKCVSNYLGSICDKSWIYFVMVSDFYDSSTGKTFEIRKKEFDDIIASFNKDDRNLYQNYFIFDSPYEEKQGYKQYIAKTDTNSENFKIKIGEVTEESETDCHAEVKRKFIEKVLQGLTGDRELEWKRLKDISLDEVNTCKDYFVYSDKEMINSDDYPKDAVQNCALKSGGYLYHIKGIDMKTLKLDRSINEYYILIMPYIEATIIYTMTGNESTFQEGCVEIKLEIKEEYRDLVNADDFKVIFTMDKSEKDDGEYKKCKLEKSQNGYVGKENLKSGSYHVYLRGRNKEIFLNELIEEEFIIEEKEKK